MDALKKELDGLKANKKPKDTTLDARISGIEETISLDELRLSGHAQWRADVQNHIDVLESQIAAFKDEQAEADQVPTMQAHKYTFKVD